MTSIVRLLVSTFHPATGSVRAGEVVEVPSDLGEHWTNNNIAEDAAGQEVTRRTASEAPTGQDGPNEFGQWPDPRPLDAPDPQQPQAGGRYSSMTSRSDLGMAPPIPPTTAEGEPTVAEPTSGPMTGENELAAAPQPTSGDVPFTAEGTMRTEPEPAAASPAPDPQQQPPA